ncbi:MATE family efflux transporter [Flavisolibacter ginsengisoli]|jgi:O-antigen/teichoic acid export membrane protein|uniref:Membrane protein involved in the export of O-antigen and teichoic acid n=1 Tax=Flavisolibacter ginsengisoli DSM 18119 TaxID=1121884 RepID=A0A1M5BA62_9BACT|nr:polysaccharide biosynthesis protein [Flavisolibacter ginsengisoli]SHF39338.1 Membrane protein involved in the export of O-antigen and teichoic acid [Flavisolibacter ginsengisoli DSM 18119]
MINETIALRPGEDIHKIVQPKKKEDLKQRAYLNSLSSIIDYAGAQITGFIINPFIVRGLGSSMYGVWQMLGQMTGYTKIVDTRATQVLKWTLANKRDVAEIEEFKTDITTALIVTAITLPISLIIGAAISWYSPYITQADEKYYSLIRITCALLISCLIINKFFGLFEAILGGMNLGYKRMGLRAAIIVLGGALKVLAITRGFGLIGLSCVQILVSIVTGYSFYIILKKNIPWFSLGKTNLSKVKSFGKLSGWFMVFTTIKMFLLSSDKIILGYLAGTVYVSKYALTMFSSLAVQGALVAVITGMTPGICSLFGKGEYDKVKKARRVMISIVWLLSVSVGVAILLLNKSFIHLWVGTKHYAGNIENLLILLISIQVVFFQLDSFIISATLNMKSKVLLSACASALTILLSFLLVNKFYIVGLCISTLLGRMFYTIGFPRLLKKQMKDDTPVFTRQLIQPLLILILFFTLATYAGQYIFISNWLYLLCGGSISLILSAVLFWFTGMEPTMRKETWNVLSRIKLMRMK